MLNDRKRLNEIIDDEIYKMVGVNRFSTRNRLHEENIASHSYFVTYLAKTIGKKCNLNNEDMCKLLSICTVHDIPESILGDIISPVKEYIPQLNEAYEEMELKVMRENYPQDYVDFLLMKEEEKNDTLVYKIFKLCDLLSVILYCEEEFKLGSNSAEMYDIHSKTIVLCIKRWQEIKNIVNIK